MKTINAISIGIGIWAVAVTFFTLSFYVPILNDLEQQANIVLMITILPLVWFGASNYYKSHIQTPGYLLGLVFLVVAALLDAAITVPLFIIPYGGNHYTFFTDLGFWLIALEIVGVATLFYYTKVYPKTKTLKA